jgi:sugar/nucleoside kinase (ribokinase family)
VDILFANEAEIRALYQVRDFEAAVKLVRGHCEVAALTRSERGSVIVAGAQTHVVAAHPVKAVVDTTGAGDLYAAGFMLGLSRDLSLPACGRLGALAAAEVISHVGARPMTPLAELAKAVLA